MNLSKLPIIKFTSFFIAPYILVFAIYVQTCGESSPGGGFQAGAIFASLMILRSFFIEDNYSKYYKYSALFGVLGYIIMGFICIICGGNYLEYSAILEDAHLAEKMCITIIELMIGITVASSMLLMYFTTIKN